MREIRNVYKILVGKREGKRLLRRPRHRWEDNIKMDLRDIGLEGVHWIYLIQERVWWQALLITVMNLQVPQLQGISCLAEHTISFSRRTLHNGVS
jgi:hypothetical protein